MLHRDLALCLAEFIDQFCASLSPAQGAAPPAALTSVPLFVGDYVQNADPPSSESYRSVTLTPNFVLQVASGAVTPTPGGPSPFNVPTDLGTPRKQTIVLLEERADIVVDDRATLERVMADFDQGRAWARSLSALSNRSALAVPLSQITAVPQGLPAGADLQDLRAVLLHFFTYRHDGTYYPKYTTPPPTGRYPKDITTPYIEQCFLETKLQQGRMHIYAVLPESVWSGAAGRPGYYRELVVRMDDRGSKASPRYRASLLHTAGLYVNPATPPAAIAQIVAFFTSEGTGLRIGEGAYASLPASTAGLVHEAQLSIESLRAQLAAAHVPIFGSDTAPFMSLLGRVRPTFPSTPLPPSVSCTGDGPVRTFRVPLEQVVALAERDDIVDLEAAAPMKPSMDMSGPALDLADFYTGWGVTSATGGTNVLIGIIDGGVDGTHQAFLKTVGGVTTSRIVAAWDQTYVGPTPATPDKTKSPLGKRSGSSAAVQASYQGLDYGQEYDRARGENVRQNFDSGSHGTHVAGIACGLPVTVPATSSYPLGGGSTWPGGVAQGAELIVVRTGASGLTSDVLDGVRYCFQRAKELGRPCVCNVSLGTHRNAHDGTDPLSIGLTQFVSRLTPTALDPDFDWDQQAEFVPGRAIVAAVGNERNDDIHYMAEVGPKETIVATFTPAFAGDGCTFWAYSKDNSEPVLEISASIGNKAAGTLSTTRVVGNQPTHAAVSDTVWSQMVTVDLHNGPPSPGNGHKNFEVRFNATRFLGITAAFTPQAWRVNITNKGSSKVYVDGWTIVDTGGGVFSGKGLNNTRKICTPAAAVGTIAVGSFISRATGSAVVGDLSVFSGPGPLRATKGRQGIDVTAPGEMIYSARSGSTNDVTAKRGTSMASPHVTGLVACMLGKTPTLTLSDIRTKLRAACDAPTDKPDDWGSGKLNAKKIAV